jgi:glycosyltransferase involved in cell wall biosynthesis
MISGESFVYFGPERWDSMWRNRHQLLSRLARSNKVVYVEPRPYVDQVLGALRRRELSLAGLFREECMVPERQDLWVYRPPRYAPLGGPPPVRAVTHELRRRALRAEIAALGMDAPVVCISTPTQFDARLDLPAKLRLYHVVDDYLAYHDLAADRRDRYARMERELIDWADLVVVVSPELLETKSQGADRSKFRVLPNGYDGVAYSPERPVTIPSALAGYARPMLGYVGLISVRLDLRLLHELVSRHPEWTLVLMGTVYPQGCEDALTWLLGRPNVHLLPPVPGNEVADYVRSFDLGLLPYRVTQETVHASPLKLYEYLAAGLPVVAADVPGAQQFAGALTIARSLSEWESGIAAALDCDNDILRAARRDAVAAHTWDARVEALSADLIEAMEAKCGSQ